MTPPEDPVEPTRLALEVSEPTEEEASRGVVAHFAHPAAGWSGTVSRGDNGLVISRLSVELRPDSSAGITSRMLREIPVGRIVDDIRVWALVKTLTGQAGEIAEASGIAGPFVATVGPMPADEIFAANPPMKAGPGRAALPDELLRAVAEGYLTETAPGKPRGAVKRLADAFGRPEQTVSRWVARARRDGWLGPGTPGREGAEPGPRLLEARTTDNG